MRSGIHKKNVNTTVHLLLKISPCSFPLQGSSITKALQGSWGAGRLAFPWTEGAGTKTHPLFMGDRSLSPRAVWAFCLAVLYTIIFFNFKVYFEVWIRFYRVWLLLIGLINCNFVTLQEQISQQFLAQWFYNLIFQLEAGCAGID